MNKEIVPDKKALQDPLIAGWVLRRLEKARRVGNEHRTHQLVALFDEVTLRRLIADGDDRIRTDLMRILDRDQLAPLEGKLLDLWSGWTGPPAYWGARLLAEMSPERFVPVIAGTLADDHSPMDFEKFVGVMEAVALMGRPASALAGQILDALGEDVTRSDLFDRAAMMSARTDPERSVSILASALHQRSRDEQRLDGALSAAFQAISDDAPYYRMFADVMDGATRQRLEGLSELFETDAPFAELDRIARSKPARRLKDAIRLIRSSPAEAPETRFAVDLLDDVKTGKLDAFARGRLASFFLGSIAAAWTADSIELSGHDPDSLVRLAAADVYSLPYGKAIGGALAVLDRRETAPALLDALEATRDHYGSTNIAGVMGQLGYREFIGPLIDRLRDGERGFLCEAATQALGRIGAGVEEAVLARWDAMDDSQRIYSTEVLEFVGGEKTVERLPAWLDSMKGDIDDLDNWCSLAEAVPDPRTVELLKHELKRKQPSIDRAFVTICRLLDTHPDEYDEVMARVVERRADTAKKLAAFHAGDVDGLIGDTMRLDLVCSVCDEENTFEVSRIYMSLDDPGAGPYIGDDLTCPSCDTEGPFEITPRGQMSLTAEVLKITASAKRGGEQKSPLEFVDTQLADGTVMAPGAAVRHYHDRVRSDPGSVEDLLSLGNLYRNLGPERLAVEYYERCLQLEPGCAEAARSLSSIRMEEGRFEDAWPVLRRAWMHRDRWKLYRLLEASPQQFESVFVGQYDEVARKLGHPTIQPAERERVDIELVAPPRRGLGKRRKKRKIGRNQPCPCGSGKKYKRCCLGKDRG